MLSDLITITHRYGQYLVIRQKSDAAVDLPRVGESILQASLSWVEEVVATKTEICIKCSPSVTSEDIAQITDLPLPQYEASHYRLPVFFDGAEWQEVTAATGLQRSVIIDIIVSTEFTYAMHGFLPGFMYLDGLPTALHCARKQQPSTRPISQAFALGGPYAGVYDLPSPSGWHVIGKLPIRIYDKGSSLALRPGDRVRVEAITAVQYEELQQRQLTLESYQLC